MQYLKGVLSLPALQIPFWTQETAIKLQNASGALVEELHLTAERRLCKSVVEIQLFQKTKFIFVPSPGFEIYLCTGGGGPKHGISKLLSKLLPRPIA